MIYTAEHHELMASIRRFISAEIDPFVDEWEAAEIFPAHDVFRKMGQLGFLGITKPEAYGGMGLDFSYALAAAEAIGYVKAQGVGMGIGVQANMATPALASFGSDELKREFLAPAIAGEVVCSIGVSEQGAGSDVSSLKTRARRDGDDYVISGSKMWITNGTQADWLCLLARTDPDSQPGDYHGMSLIIVPTTTPGFSVGRKIEKMGNRCSDTAEIVLDAVRVPVSNTIGEPDRGFQQQMAQFQDERLVGAYIAVAGARRALDRTKEYLQQRIAFGKPLLANQHLQYRLAELYADVDTLDGFLQYAADKYMAGQDVTREATVAKLKTGRLVREVADTCVQFHGGMGYAEEMWAARYFRDARLVSIGGGADEVMLRVISMLEGMGKK